MCMLERHPDEATRMLEGKFLQQPFVDLMRERGLDPEKALPAELLVTAGKVKGVQMESKDVVEAILAAGNVTEHMDALNLRVSLSFTTKMRPIFL